MIVVWIAIGAFFAIGLYLALFPTKLVSWWIERHRQITDKLGAFKPIGGYRLYLVLGPVVFRVAGLMLLGGSLYMAYIVLFR